MDEPDFTQAPERKLQEKPEREQIHDETQEEYLKSVDSELHHLRKERSKHGLAWIIKYIGAWYIVLAIFKGLFYEFSPTFDILGLGLFVIGSIWERQIKRREQIRNLT